MVDADCGKSDAIIQAFGTGSLRHNLASLPPTCNVEMPNDEVTGWIDLSVGKSVLRSQRRNHLKQIPEVVKCVLLYL